MNSFKKSSLSVLLAILLVNTAPTYALDKPKTMEEMWRIIQAQQQQIDSLKAAIVNKSESTPTANANVSTNSNADVQKLERKTNVLSQEVEKLRTNLSIPEEPKYKSAYGLGPAASKVYGIGRGLSVGGYGEGNYQTFVGDKNGKTDVADMERMVLYVGYKFSDKVLFNSELEFEHATTGEGAEEKGEVSVEFAALDFFIDPIANVRAGMVLMPMGFINQIHEPLFFFGNNRPEVERYIIPSTWREMGVGLFGQITPDLTYTAYIVNGLNAAEYKANGIRDGRQAGSNAQAENFGYVVRMDYNPQSIPSLTVGGSTYVGYAGQNQSYAGQKINALTQLYEGHLQWKYRGLEVRALGSFGYIDDADILSKANKKNQTIGSENYGWYTEVGYDIMPLLLRDSTQYLAPFFRYEQYDTIANAPTGYADDASQDKYIYQFGLQYKPIPNVVIKADYRNFNAKKGTLADDFNLGFGFIF